MTEVPQWINQNILSSSEHRERTETYQSISDFCVMWVIFETTLLSDTDNTVEELIEIATRLSHSYVNLEVPLKFWTDRYVSNDGINSKFERLKLKQEEHIDLVKRVLLGEKDSLVEKTHALLLIVYRMRNNLFHGNKDITRIHEQKENLNIASGFLKNVISSSGRHIYLNIP